MGVRPFLSPAYYFQIIPGIHFSSLVFLEDRLEAAGARVYSISHHV